MNISKPVLLVISGAALAISVSLPIIFNFRGQVVQLSKQLAEEKTTNLTLTKSQIELAESGKKLQADLELSRRQTAESHALFDKVAEDCKEAIRVAEHWQNRYNELSAQTGAAAKRRQLSIATQTNRGASSVPTASRRASTPDVQPDSVAAPTPSMLAVRSAAQERADRYFRYEYQLGSSAGVSISVRVVTNPPEEIPGWLGEYHVYGTAYLTWFDTAGGSAQNTNRDFEVRVKSKGDQISDCEFTLK